MADETPDAPGLSPAERAQLAAEMEAASAELQTPPPLSANGSVPSAAAPAHSGSHSGSLERHYRESLDVVTGHLDLLVKRNAEQGQILEQATAQLSGLMTEMGQTMSLVQQAYGGLDELMERLADATAALVRYAMEQAAQTAKPS